MKKKLILLFVLFAAFNSFSQRNITGEIIDAADNNPLIGVNVMMKNVEKRNTTTDAYGNFSLSIEKEGVLIISYLGYKTVEIATDGKSDFKISMVEDNKILKDVVVTGYAVQNKRESAGAVSTIKSDKIKQVPLATFDQILQGQAPGLLVVGGSGQPGSAATVRLRGISSITGSNAPLYVLDGIQITAGNFASLNPEDFGSVTILKDAAATSIYGSRGANGVIVIASKKGQAGTPKIEYSGQYGNSDYPRNPIEVMNSAEKVDYELLRGGTSLIKLSKEELDKLRNTNTNWEEFIFQKGITQQHQLAISGGNDNTTYYISGNIFNQSGTVIGTKLNRYTGRVNLESKQGNFTFGVNASMGFSKYNYVAESDRNLSSPLNGLRWANPYEKPYNADGTYTKLRSGFPNPVQEIKERQRDYDEIKGVGNFYLQYNVPFINGLALRTNWGTDYENSDIITYASKLSAAGAAANGKQGFISHDNAIQNRITGTNSISYTKNFGDHYLNAGLYNEIVTRDNKDFGYTAYGLTGVLQNEAGITPGTPTNGFIPQVSGGRSRNALLSYFTNLTYGYKEKYYVNLGGRRDGSSRFGKNNRFANFGSVGLAWVISSENFMKNLTFLNNLKLKTSYGTVGNQEGIGAFASRELFGNETYDGKQGPVITQLANPELRWEQKNKFNVGLEYELVKSRIAGGFEYYNEVTKNLFLRYQLSRTTGFSSLNRNIGELQNAGFEAFINTVNIRKGKFEWSTNINFSYNKNKVLKLSPDTPADGIVGDLDVIRVGLPLNTYYLMEYAGVNSENGNAQYKKIDGTLTESYNPKERKAYSNAIAPYYGGFTNTLKYGNLEASAFFTYVFGNYIYNLALADLVDPNYYADNVAKDLLGEWKNKGDNSLLPRSSQAMQRNVTRFLEKGDYLRLRNVTISYSLPNNILQKAKIKSCRFFVQGQNLATFTKFRGYDPELAGTLIGSQYPPLKQITAGLNLIF